MPVTYVEGPEPPRLVHEVDRFDAEVDQESVEHPLGGGKEQRCQRHQRHQRDEVGQEADGLHRALHGAAAHLVQDQGQHDRHREGEEQIVEAEQEGVADQPEEIGVGEEADEVLQADPLAAEHADAGVVVLKGDHDPVHGDVVEDDEPGQSAQHHELQVLGLAQALEGGGCPGKPPVGSQPFGARACHQWLRIIRAAAQARSPEPRAPAAGRGGGTTANGPCGDYTASSAAGVGALVPSPGRHRHGHGAGGRHR